MSEPERVLIFIDHFLPGYKAGGPVRSCANMIEHLKDRFVFGVITSDREYMEDTPYSNVEVDAWNEGSLCPVFYTSPSSRKKELWKRLIREWRPDVVYINGIYSYRFSILPLWVLRTMETAPRKIVAPRGMLAPGAMSVKPLKKRAFLWVARKMGLFDDVLFHATHPPEKEEVRYWLGKENVRIVPNLPPTTEPGKDPGIEKKSGELKLISIARIAPEKNTEGMIRALLEHGTPEIELDLYGPVYDRAYWERCRALIAQLPEGIRVRHYPGIHPQVAPQAIRAHHAFLLLTKGENFGHAVLEALLAGRPVLISDRTPWERVEEKGAGSLIPLENEQKKKEAIRRFQEMDQEAYDELRERVEGYAGELKKSYEERDAYLKLLGRT